MINAVLGYDQAGQVAGAQAVQDQFDHLIQDNNESAANRTAAQTSSTQTARLGGTVTTGNTVTVAVSDAGLSGGLEVVNYILDLVQLAIIGAS